MATIKISQLTAAAAATGTQELEVNESGTSKKITGAQLATYIEGEVSSSPSFTGQVSLPDGTNTAPSLTNTGDTNTGIYFPAEDEVGIATGGTLRVSVNSGGSLVTTGNIELGHASDTTISRVSAGVIAVEGATIATLASPAFTGTPTAPTASAYTDSTQIATTGNVVATVKTVPENAQTGTSYTLVLADAGKMVSLSNAAAITLTIPTNASVAFPVDTRIDILQYGAGQVTVGGAGVTIRSSGSKLKLSGQYSGATLWKKDTDEWALIGDITA